MYDDTNTRQKRAQEQAREHPIRVKILALYEQDESRSLAAKDLLAELPDVDTSLSAVHYHVRVLKGAGLLPKDARAATA